MQLEEFYDYKNTLMEDLLTSPEITGLLKEGVSQEKAKTLAYKLVFPYEFVPDTVEHGDTYICYDVDITNVINKTYLLPTLYVWVFTHKSKMRLPQGGVRVDKLCSEISKVINGSRGYGLGTLELKSVKRFAPMTDFQGKVMVFEAVDINRFYNPKTPVPANRKNN